MNKDQVKGIFDELVGSAKKKPAYLACIKINLQVEGIAQQVRVKLENAWAMRKKPLVRPVRHPQRTPSHANKYN